MDVNESGAARGESPHEVPGNQSLGVGHAPSLRSCVSQLATIAPHVL
jgi:hypothetical protein